MFILPTPIRSGPKISQKGAVPLLILVAVLGLVAFLAISTTLPIKDKLLSVVFPKPASEAAETWAFEETFDYGAPISPSQDLLPKRFGYAVTHRGLGQGQNVGQNGALLTFPADHGDDCKAALDPGPITDTNPILQHTATTNHILNPDHSFFLCNNHMMSSMGHVDGYSVSAFYPRQEFDFSSGNGILEWDVNLNTAARSWWEVMITPRENTQLGAAKDWLPISETYPKDSIVLTWSDEARGILVYKDKPAPDGQIVSSTDWRKWGEWIVKDDVALTDRRIRRKMRVTLTDNKITWSVTKPDGTMDDFSVDVPGGIPFKKGLVFFKTHAYTPEKDGNMNLYTYHWDNIHFNGPKLAPYESYEIPGVVELAENGSTPIGSTKTVILNLPKVGPNPVFLGQTLQGQPGQVLLSINGHTNIEVSPHSQSSGDDPCYYDGWRTFRVAIDPSQLKVGDNTFKWTVGPRPACAVGQWWWDGFSVKAAEIQFDGDPNATPIPTVTPTPAVSSTAVPTPTLTPTPTPTPTPTAAASPSIAPSPSPTPIPSPTPRKTGDINGDGKINVADLSTLLSKWNSSDPFADLNKDGKVNVSDLSILLTNWGK